ncbi:hypothetical protein BH18ACT13_BH18ACT13_10070 [soil metagenome]
MRDEKMMQTRFELSTHVLHEAIDGEVIVIDVATGAYYSLRGSAAVIWGLVERSPGVAPGQLAEALAVRYQANGQDVEAELTRFLSQLDEEGLISAVEASGAPAADTASAEPSDEPVGVFAPPVLEKHTDMQDLVLIDPVHDVSGAGWPHMPVDAASASTGT